MSRGGKGAAIVGSVLLAGVGAVLAVKALAAAARSSSSADDDDGGGGGAGGGAGAQSSVMSKEQQELEEAFMKKQPSSSATSAVPPVPPKRSIKSVVTATRDPLVGAATTTPRCDARSRKWIAQAQRDGLDLAGAVNTFMTLRELPPPEAADRSVIDVDLPRTFPGDARFAPETPAYRALRRVLYAIERHMTPGYYQGMNYIAGHLLRHMGECETFAMMTHLLTSGKVGLCFVLSGDLAAGVNTASVQLDFLMSVHVPKLAEHLQAVGFDMSIIMDWYFCLFSRLLPEPVVDAVWDRMFEHGWLYTLHVCVALLQLAEPYIMGWSRTLPPPPSPPPAGAVVAGGVGGGVGGGAGASAALVADDDDDDDGVVDGLPLATVVADDDGDDAGGDDEGIPTGIVMGEPVVVGDDDDAGVGGGGGSAINEELDQLPPSAATAPSPVASDNAAATPPPPPPSPPAPQPLDLMETMLYIKSVARWDEGNGAGGDDDMPILAVPSAQELIEHTDRLWAMYSS